MVRLRRAAPPSLVTQPLDVTAPPRRQRARYPRPPPPPPNPPPFSPTRARGAERARVGEKGRACSHPPRHPPKSQSPSTQDTPPPLPCAVFSLWRNDAQRIFIFFSFLFFFPRLKAAAAAAAPVIAFKYMQMATCGWRFWQKLD